MFAIQTEIFTNLKSLIDNSLKRKLEYLSNISYALNIVIIQENTILNRLVKKSRSDKTVLYLFVSI